jgi:hypothetical protein
LPFQSSCTPNEKYSNTELLQVCLGKNIAGTQENRSKLITLNQQQTELIPKYPASAELSQQGHKRKECGRSFRFLHHS